MEGKSCAKAYCKHNMYVSASMDTLLVKFMLKCVHVLVHTRMSNEHSVKILSLYHGMVISVASSLVFTVISLWCVSL